MLKYTKVMTQRSRNWCFTWNNYPADFAQLTTEEQWKNIFGKFKYIVIGFEVGARGTAHLQGYVDFVNARTLGGLKRINSAIHWEPRRGTWDQATQYCMKGGHYLEFGTPNEQGKRTDLEEVKNEIVNGLKVETIVMDNPVMYHQYGRTLNKIEDIALRRNYRTTMTEGFWYWGETGVGKSHIAFQGFTPDTHYVFPNDNGWWDGYIQQPTVIFNDFRGEIPYNEMLQLVDKWPYSVRRRNREPMPFTSRRVIVTSSLPPQTLYNKRNARDAIAQLLRRFTVVHVPHNTQVVGGVILDPPHSPENTPHSGEENALRAQSIEPVEDVKIITPDEFTKALKDLRKLEIR